jgi:hypothetical protein
MGEGVKISWPPIPGKHKKQRVCSRFAFPQKNPSRDFANNSQCVTKTNIANRDKQDASGAGLVVTLSPPHQIDLLAAVDRRRSCLVAFARFNRIAYPASNHAQGQISCLVYPHSGADNSHRILFRFVSRRRIKERFESLFYHTPETLDVGGV